MWFLEKTTLKKFFKLVIITLQFNHLHKNKSAWDRFRREKNYDTTIKKQK